MLCFCRRFPAPTRGRWRRASLPHLMVSKVVLVWEPAVSVESPWRPTSCKRSGKNSVLDLLLMSSLVDCLSYGPWKCVCVCVCVCVWWISEACTCVLLERNRKRLQDSRRKKQQQTDDNYWLDRWWEIVRRTKMML